MFLMFVLNKTVVDGESKFCINLGYVFGFFSPSHRKVSVNVTVCQKSFCYRQ